MSTSHTPNYNLCQWEADDQVLRTEFNEDNAKIDAAVKAVDAKAGRKAEQSDLAALQATVDGLSTALNRHTESISKLGNCLIHYSTFTGDNASTRTYSFPHRPLFFVLADASNSSRYIAVVRGATTAYLFHNSGAETVNVAWSYYSFTVTSVANNSSHSLNASNHTYHMVALLDAEN